MIEDVPEDISDEKVALAFVLLLEVIHRVA